MSENNLLNIRSQWLTDNESIPMVKRLGLMGGTFDPIHFGHLVTAEAALETFNLDRVLFIPSGNPPHKKDYPVSDAKHRFLMTFLAVATNPYFDISTIEIQRPGYSYAIDTVKEIRQICGNDTEIFFITGADAIMEILTWKNVDKLMELCQFIAATRPGTNLEELGNFIKQLPENLRTRIHVMEIPVLAISSTDIRRRVANGKSIKYLLPESVEQYIMKNKLYRDHK